MNAQTDWERWGPAEINYELQLDTGKEYELDNSSILMTGITGFRTLYYFFISDLDGDNCPFYPSCSTFFIESVKKTNFIKGTLMFVDRFTRDSNFLKLPHDYPLHSSGKFFDPVSGYTLERARDKSDK